MQETTEPALQPLNRLVGSWSTEATHPALPGVVVRGTTSIEWLEGQRFLIVRSRNDHPFPMPSRSSGSPTWIVSARAPTNRTPASSHRRCVSCNEKAPRANVQSAPS